MGLLNKLWSGADFWDKNENKQQRDDFARQDEERRKREAEARAQAQAAKAAQQAQRDAQRQQAPTVVSPTVTSVKQPTFGPQVPNQPEVLQQLFKPLQTTPNPLLTPPPAPEPVKLNKFGNPEPVRGMENGKAGTYYTGKATGKRTFIEDPVKEDNSNWGKIKRGLGIAKDTAQGTVGAVPQVALAAGRTATGLVQGAGQLPHMGTAILATGTEKLANNWSNPVTRQLNRGFQDLNTGVKTATHYAIDDVFDPINRNLDHASQMYGRTVQDSEDIGTKNYEQTQIGLNVLAALLTLGGTAAVTNAGKAGRAGEIATGASKPGKFTQVMDFLNKPVAGSSDDIISKIGGGATDKLANTANALNAPFGTTKNKLLEVFGGAGSKSEALDAAATGAKVIDTATPNQVAPGVVSTNKTPEVRAPEPVVRPEPIKPSKPVKNEVPQVVRETPVVPKSTDETLAGLKGRRESLAAERDDLLTNGGDVKEVERQIKSIDNAIAEHTTPPKTVEAKVLAEGDKQLAEATTVKPVKTVQQVNDPNPNALPIKPSNGDVITDHEALAESARKYDSIAEWRDKTNTDLIDGNGRMTDPVTGENISAKQFFDNAKANAGDAPAPKLQTQAEKDAFEVERANSVRKAEGQAPLETKAPKKEAPKTVETEKPNVAQSEPTPVKEPKTVKPEPAKTEAPSKPKPSKAELQKGAAENTTKAGKVSVKWRNQQLKDGADPTELRSAIEKVEGPKTPPKVIKEKPVDNGGIPLDGKQGVGKHGDIYETTSDAVNVEQGKRTLKKTGEEKFLNKMEEKAAKGDEAFNTNDRNAAKRLLDSGKYPDGSEAQMLLNSIVVNVNKNAAQVLATAHRLHRATATEDDLINRLIQRTLRMSDNQVKLTADDLADVRTRTKSFIDARAEFNKAQEAYYKAPTPENQQAALKAAHTKQQLDREQKIAELNAIAGRQGDKVAKKEMYKLIDKLGKEADVWQMDYVDTGLLSTTGTWVANIVNSIGGGVEEALFGKAGAFIARARTGTDIGGGNAFGANAQKFGFRKLFDEAKNRTQLPSKNIADKGMNYLKNFVTTMNEIGNTQIDAGAHASVSAEYARLLKAEYPKKFGGKLTKEAKKELDRLVEYNAVVDPRDIKQKYIDYGFKVQGMAAVLGKAGKTNAAKLENKMASGISEFLRKGDTNPMPKGLADAIGKLTMRVTLGFPTIVARSAGQGMRRVTGGAPTFLQAKFTKDPVEKAMLIKQGIKEMGSGAAMVSAGAMAGQSGMITGAYPTDKTTQDEWAKEGKSEWSIKVGDDYYGLPRMLGPFAIPFLVGAQMGENNESGDGIFQADAFKQMANSVAKSYDATMPAGQISDNIETITNLKGLFSEDENEQKKANAAFAKFAGNALRIGAVPLSGMFNQITQSTTDTQKDTKGDGGIVEPIISYVMSGLPGLNQKLADKTSNDGTVLTTTDPGARLFGAQSTENAEGVADNKQQVEDNQNDLTPIINDKNIYDLLEPETQKLLDQTQDPKSKKRLNDQNLETIRKDVSQTTEKLASEGKWGSYGNSLKIKLNVQKADKQSTAEEQALTQRQVTQADILDKNGIDAKIFSLYDLSAEKGGISAADFKKMIDPEETDYYDMDTAQALWKLDKLFTEAGVSGNNTGAIDPWTKQKYSMPKDKSGSGSGGGKDKGIGTNFGTLGAFAKSPGSQSQKYQKLTNSGSPLANLTTSSSKTNLRKNISVVKGVRL